MHLCHTSAGIAHAHAHGVANHDDEVYNYNVSSAQKVRKQMDLSPSHKNILTETIHIHQLNNWTTQREVESDIHKIKFSHLVSTPNLFGSQIPNQGNLIKLQALTLNVLDKHKFISFFSSWASHIITSSLQPQV